MDNINYERGLFFKDDECLKKIKKILESNNIKYKEESCYLASLNTEIKNKLEDAGYEVTNDNIDKVKDKLENYDIWHSLETYTIESIDNL